MKRALHVCPTIEDLTGQRFGKLVVMHKNIDKPKSSSWFCRCDCGNETIVSGTYLRFGYIRSCGCLRHRQNEKLIDEIGNKYGNLLVIGRGKNRKHSATWLCRCECGKEIVVNGSSLRLGHTKSCGCLSCLNRKTEEKFIASVKEIASNEYEVLGNYLTANIPILFKHNICGHEYKTRPNTFLQGKRCPKCAHENLRRKSDANHRITNNLRSRIIHVLRGREKSAPTMKLLGCTLEKFISYIEHQFENGMTWDNYGKPNGWQIDHIRPCASFSDLSDPEQQKACFHHINLRPLWAVENIKKHSWWNGVHHRSDDYAP